jgi:hypothetical protein
MIPLSNCDKPQSANIKMTAFAPLAVKLSRGMVAMLCAPPSGANICTRLRAMVTMVSRTKTHFAIGLPR